MYFLRNLSLAFIFVFSVLSPQTSYAQFTQCKKLNPDQQLQADYCATHAACRIAINLLKSCAEVTEALQKFYDSFSKSKTGEDLIVEADSKETEQAKIDRISKADRKAGFDECIRRRGENMRDFCFDAFASSDDIAQKRKAEADKWAAKARADDLNEDDKSVRERASLTVKDNSLRGWLSRNCTPKQISSSYCFQYVDEALRLGEKVDAFNAKPSNTRTLGPVVVVSPGIAAGLLKEIEKTGAPRVRASAVKPPSEGGAIDSTPKSSDADVSAGSTVMKDLPKRDPSALDDMFRDAIAGVEPEAVARETKEMQERQKLELAERAAIAEAAAKTAADRAAAEKQRLLDQAEDHTIQNGKVGELYSLADQLEAQGKTDKSRKAFRSLIARFPDHPLAATAAGRLAALSSMPPRTAIVGQTSSSNSANGSGNLNVSGNCEAEYQALSTEMKGISARSSNLGGVRGFRAVMYIASKSLMLGNGACKNSKYMAELTSFQPQFDSAKQACLGISTNPAQCVPALDF